MDTLKKYFLLSALACLSFVTACSSDDDEETKPYMSGSIANDAPSYASVGDLLTINGSGIFCPEDVKYKWYIAGFLEDTLTAQKITVQMPDTTDSFTFVELATHPDYYSSSGSFILYVIDTTFNKSLTGITRSGKSITDSRDGKEYSYVTIGSLDWFSQNLAYRTGTTFKNSPIMDGLFGRYYHWDTATGGVAGSGLGGGPQGACPEGWSVPTNEDWEDLAKAMNGGDELPFNDRWEGLGDVASTDAYLLEERLWPYSPKNDHKNTFGWNALPVGNTTFYHEDVNDYEKYGFWWSSSERDGKYAYYRYIYYDLGSFPMNYADKSDFGASVRCVRLAQ